jgi:hypothetical protein
VGLCAELREIITGCTSDDIVGKVKALAQNVCFDFIGRDTFAQTKEARTHGGVDCLL